MSERKTFSSKKMRRKHRRFSFRRMARRTANLSKIALESLKSYPEIRKSTPVSLFDVLSAVSALGVIAATVVWAVI